MKKVVWKKLLAGLLVAALLPLGALTALAAERTVSLPAGKMWAYVSNHGKWGVGTESHALKLYKLADSNAVSGNAATSIENGGIYLIGDTAPVESTDTYRKMYAQAGATDSCGESTTLEDPYTLPGGCQGHKTNHMFQMNVDDNGWYTIKSLSNNMYLDISSCTMDDYNQIPFTDTPTKFAVVKSGSDAGMFTIAAAVVDPNTPPELDELTEPLYGAIVDDDLQYIQTNFSAALADATTATLNAWRNDTAVSQIFLAAGQNDLTRVTATAGDFSDGKGHTIAAQNVDLSFIKVVKAYTGMPGYATVPARPVPTGSRKDAAEVLMGADPVDVDTGRVQGLWVSVNVPKDAEPGSYQGQVTVTADDLDETEKLTFTYTLNVASSVLPDATEFKGGFDIELWQNPYASAEYYNVTPFSPEHFAILTPIMEKYKSIGGHAITTTIVDEAWNGQTYSANDVHYPSMVKWTKKADGTWAFNYDQFDAWVSFCKNDIRIGDKLVCYSIAPWSCAISYYDEASQRNQSITVSTPAGHSDEWDAAWTACLTALKDHLTEKGWTEGVYVGFDERGFSTGAFDLVDSVKGSDGERFFRIAGAMDGFVDKRDLAMRTDVLSVGSVAVKGHLTEYRSLLADRNAAGKSTTVYTCTGHIPGSFSLSAPGESYWTMLYSYSVGGTGYLRWAYDSWVANPLQDTTHCNFEAGDCFLIFPDEKGAANPVAHSSLRLEKMAQGVRDVNKLMTIRANCPAMESAVDTLAATVKPNYDSSGYYLTDAGKTALAADMKTLRQGIVTLTAEYEERLAIGATKKVNLQPKDVPIVMLPEQYQGDVWGPIVPVPENKADQYFGQPDMITLTDGTLVTLFPKGHGKGAVLLMKSDNRGESWERIATPTSWANSWETPTMYRLNFADGKTVKYVVISGRPAWYGNTAGGWDASVSNDGINWTEYETYHSDTAFSTVAMASLVQLKDPKTGKFIDKWMGVYHDSAGFVNYKTYLTFDRNGNMQWSAPVPYLSAHRSVEQAKGICEVGMFRSPDGNRIVAMARTQSHNCLSVIFWSDDEGENWTRPVDMQGALYGERHKALYDPISGRLVITFREMICTSVTANGGFGGWTCGEWMAWVGTYEDLMEFNEGQYRIRLDEDWAPSGASGDTGYTGMAVYPDGTFVLDTYGHWDKEYSQNSGLGSTSDRCWIRRAKFKLSDIDALYKTRLETEVPTEELDSAILAENAKANSWRAPTDASANDGGPAWAFDDAVHWWHSNYDSATDENINGQDPSEEKPIWIQTGFGAARDIHSISYQGRTTGNNDIISAYELQLACLENPNDDPTDEDFKTVASGNFSDTRNAQTVTLTEPVRATHMRLVAKGSHRSGGYVSAQRIRVYAVGEAAYRSDEARLTSLYVNGAPVAVSDSTDLGAVTVAADASTATLTAAYSDKAKLNLVVNGLPASKDAPIPLTGDVTQVKLRVVAEDTVTTTVYDLAIVKQKENNAQLRKLSLGTLKLYPAFDPAVTEYYAVAYGNRTAGLTAVAAQSGAVLTYEAVADKGTGTGAVNGATCRFFKSQSATAANGKLYTKDGKLYNKVAVTVTPPDGSSNTTYTIHVEVRESAYLSDLGWSAIVGNVPIRDRAWSYNELALIGAGGEKIMSEKPKGLGVRANTVVEYDLSDWGFDTISGRVGVSYAQRASTSVPELQFRVILGGQEAMMQSSTKNAAAPAAFTVDLGAANKLALRTTAVGASVTDADGNWTDLKLSTIIPLLENLDSEPITALEFAENETHIIYANEGNADHTVTLRPTVTPADSTELLLWESDNTAVATVNDGVVTAVAPGTATITVRASGNPVRIFATCPVTVKRAIEGNVVIDADGDGKIRLGSKLTANVNDIVSEFKTQGLNYVWSVRDTADSEGTVIPGAETDQFTIPMEADYVGNFITVTVTPKGQYHDGEAFAVTAAVEKAVGPALQAVPTFENASASDATDGAITGLFQGRAYQYQKVENATDPVDEDAWIDFCQRGDDSDITGNFGRARIENLGVGTYIIRRAEDDTHEAGPHRTVTIAVRDAGDVVVNNPQIFDGGRVTVGRTQIPVGNTVRLTVVPDTGYELEWLKAITSGGAEVFAEASDTTEGLYTFEMPNVASVTISAQFRLKTYTITHSLPNITCSLGGEESHTATHGEAFTITLTPDPGYNMPDRVTVTSTATGTAFTDFTYRADEDDPTAMVLTFRNGVTGSVTISGAATPKTYTAVYRLTNGLVARDAPQTATYSTDFTVTLSAARGYALPETVSVTVGGVAVEAEYDQTSGKITVPGEKVTGNIVITAAGEAQALTLQTISLIGPAREGRTLTVKTVPVNATVEYQWIMVDENGVETEIDDATQPEYFIPAEAVGQKIKVRVTGTGSYAGTLTSEPTATILREAEQFVFVDSVSVQSDATVNVGRTVKLSAKAEPSNATSPILFWSSSNEAIATVDQNGVVKGVAEGTVTITVASTDRVANRTATCRVTVTEATSPSRPSTGGSGSSTTTTTETREDGSKVTTVTKPDGTVTETVEQPDGTKSETVTTKDGDVTITVTDETGEELVKAEIPATIPETETRFEDVPVDHWADEAIHNAAALKLVNGVGNNKYDMVSPMTRGSLATVLHRLSQGKTDYENTFKDVAQGKYYTEGVAWAAKAKVVTGYSADIFAPDDIITREQLAVMLARYAKLIGMDTKADSKALDKFTDGENTGAWAVDGVAWCVENGILKGKGENDLDPTAKVTRAEVAVMLDRFIGLIK